MRDMVMERTHKNVLVASDAADAIDAAQTPSSILEGLFC